MFLVFAPFYFFLGFCFRVYLLIPVAGEFLVSVMVNAKSKLPFMSSIIGYDAAMQLNAVVDCLKLLVCCLGRFAIKIEFS